MKRIKIALTICFAVLFIGCNGANPNVYTKDYSNEKIFIRTIFVKQKYQAESIIKQLDNSNNKLQKFIELQKSYSIAMNGKSTNLHAGWWADSINYQAWKGNTVFELNSGEYTKKPLAGSIAFEVVFLEKKITQREFKKLQSDYNNKILERIAAYETDYMNEYKNIMENWKDKQVSYVQPYNKKESCKIWMGHYGEETKWFEEDSYKISWDGSCKNGYASGLGREIETADMLDRWGIAIYKKGKPTYYITNDLLSNIIFEGIINDDNAIDSYGVETLIKVKANDIEVTTTAGMRNSKEGTKLLSITSPFWNGSYTYAKEYPNFRYTYFNNKENDTNANEFEFFIVDKNGKNGWAINKNKNGNIVTGEYVNNVAKQLNLPKEYNEKADKILKEIHSAQQKAFNAQEYAQKVKKQYLKRICKNSIKVNFMDNNDYKEICSDKKALVVMQKINNKLNKISEEKIARLEKQRFNEQQQKEEKHRQEMLSLERSRLAEIQRHNITAEMQEDKRRSQQGWKNLNDQINNMTPKTYNVNVMHY